MDFHETKKLLENFLAVEVWQEKDVILEASTTSETKVLNRTWHDHQHSRNGDAHRTKGSHTATQSSPFTRIYIIVTTSNIHLFILRPMLKSDSSNLRHNFNELPLYLVKTI